MTSPQSNPFQAPTHDWDSTFRTQAATVQDQLDRLRIQRRKLFDNNQTPAPEVLAQLGTQIEAVEKERRHIAWERQQEGLRIGKIQPPPTLQELARRNVQEGHAWVVTMPNGEQFLVPSEDDAQETSDARGGGCIDRASIFKVPGELYGEYRYRPNYKWDTPWRDWPEWSEADEARTVNDEPLTAEQLGALETEGRVAEMLVEGWLPAAGVNPLIGDSGLGKTPLVLQLVACVASSTDFLGLPTRGGKVLICDYENLGLLTGKLREVSKAIGVNYDEDVAPQLRFLNSPTADEVFKAARKHEYTLIIVDSFRGICGGQDIDGKIIVPLITRMSKVQSCWVLIHHVRKGDRKAPPPDLTDLSVRVLAWLEEASGHRSLINQTFTRFGIVAPRAGADLFIRAFVKGHGEKGPLLLERVHDAEDPELPIGYRIAQDWSMLPDNERGAYMKVAGQTLSWSELAKLFGKNQTTKLLEACRNSNLVSEPGKAYSKGKKYVFRPLTVDNDNQATAAALG